MKLMGIHFFTINLNKWHSLLRESFRHVSEKKLLQLVGEHAEERWAAARFLAAPDGNIQVL